MASLKPNDEVFRYYFYFMQERMNIFWRKCEGAKVLTNDPILRKYKFTNVYRACDRVSQYLIRNVIYNDLERYTPEDILLRILVFKIFNKIETWELLQSNCKEIKFSTFNPDEISERLTRLRQNQPIFSNAYMMTGSHKDYDYLRFKHEKWLAMVKKEFVDGGAIHDILRAKSLEEIYNRLNQCPFIGGFLAYQYSIDFNYSPYINFDENSFVKAGIGAIRGIKKCFFEYGKNYEDAIYYTFYNLDELRQHYGYENFKALPGRKPHLIDLQNCFCETDKYLREAMPSLQVDNVRIKQKYKPIGTSISFTFPSKWNITKNIETKCTKPNTKALMLF